MLVGLGFLFTLPHRRHSVLNRGACCRNCRQFQVKVEYSIVFKVCMMAASVDFVVLSPPW